MLPVSRSVQTDLSGPASLTPQQLEIAQLAAEGLTNKEIGERLFLSHRTVGTHLYQLFPKLGITSRAALRDALRDLPTDAVTSRDADSHGRRANASQPGPSCHGPHLKPSVRPIVTEKHKRESTDGRNDQQRRRAEHASRRPGELSHLTVAARRRVGAP